MLLSRNKSMILLLLLFRISQGSVVTRLRCRGKYGKSLVENLLPSPTMKEFLKSANISQSYERILSGTFFLWLTVYICSTIQRLQTVVNIRKWSGVFGPFACNCGVFIMPPPVGGRGRGH